MMGAVEEERPSQGFFDSASAASFMRQIKIAVDRKVASPESRPSVSRQSTGTAQSTLIPTPRGASQSTAANYVLPPRKMADSLMEVSWTLVFPLYPFLDRARMTSEYSKLWTGESSDSDENMLMCTFNVIFALAASSPTSSSPPSGVGRRTCSSPGRRSCSISACGTPDPRS